MDPAPTTINVNTSVSRSYNIFRTMGLRHLIVVDGELNVVGLITRSDVNEHRLAHYWHDEREKLQKELNIDSLPPAVIFEPHKVRDRSSSVTSNQTVETVDDHDADAEIVAAENNLAVSDSPRISLRKKLSDSSGGHRENVSKDSKDT